MKFSIDVDTKRGLVMIDPCGGHDFSLAKKFDGLDRGEKFIYSGVLYTISHFMNDVIGVDLFFDPAPKKTVTFLHHEQDGKIRDLVAQALMHTSTQKIQNLPVTINLESVEKKKDEKRLDSERKKIVVSHEHRHTFETQNAKEKERYNSNERSTLSKKNTFKNGVNTVNPSYKPRSYLRDPVSVFRNRGTVDM